jgi:hypothetical protein
VSLVHQVLTRENPFAFARDRIAAVAKRFSGLVYEVAGLLVERFDPSAPLADAAFHTRVRGLDERIDRSAEAEDVRRILRTMTAAVAAVRGSLGRHWGLPTALLDAFTGGWFSKKKA